MWNKDSDSGQIILALSTYMKNPKDRKCRQCTPEQYSRRKYYVSDIDECMHNTAEWCADTYKPPSRKITVKPTLRFFVSFNVQIMESGSARIQKSRATLNAEDAM